MVTRNELMVSSAGVYPVCGWYVAAALARHWLLLYTPIWVWVLMGQMRKVWGV